MYRQLNQTLFFIIASIALFLPTMTNAQEGLWKISLEIKKGFLQISATGNLQIPAINRQTESQNITIPVNNAFQIRDAGGFCSGHYSTIQVGNLKNWSHIIPKENISINISQINTIAGLENPSNSVWPTIYNIYGSFYNPSTYLYRAIATDCGKIGQYSNTGNLQIHIDPDQEAGNYRWQIYYLLIDHN